MSTFPLSVVTPERSFFEGNVEGVIVRTVIGDVGILKGHANYIAPLAIGALRIKIDGKYKACALANGFIKVSEDKTTILAMSCEWADEIDLARAEEAQKRASKNIQNPQKQSEHKHAEVKLKRALNRINVVNRYK